MKKVLFLVSALLLASVLVVACAPQAVPEAVPVRTPPPAPVPVAAPAAVAARPAWQVEWDRVVEAAKKEGTLVHLSQVGPVGRHAVAEAFQQKFGIGIEWLAGSSAELAVKILSERRAGIFSADVGIIAHVTPRTVLKPAGALESLDKVLFLPELTDAQEIQKVWRSKVLEWVDQEHSILVFAPRVTIPLFINTQLVKTGEMKGYKDLLNPKWKVKIVLIDPTIATGAAPTWAQAVGTYIMGWDYLRQLADQEVFITRDNRLAAEWVAHGKYPIGIALEPEVVKEFIDVGAPIKPIFPEEGSYTVAGPNTIIQFKDAPHPNAAKLYINWLLSKEGQAIYCKAMGYPSGRLDVTIEGIDTMTIPVPELNYTRSYSEEAVMARADALNKAKEAFAKAKK